MLLTLFEFRQLHETDLTDAALQLLLDAAEQEIIEHSGDHATQTDNIVEPRSRSIFLERKAATITTITERVGNEETVLAANDWRMNSPRELGRRDDGTNPRLYWGEHVKVQYVPVSDLTIRKRVQTDLVKLAAQYNAADDESLGDYRRASPEYQEERKKILAQLDGGWTVR